MNVSSNRCPCCGAEAREHYGDLERYRYARCAQCGLLFVDNPPRETESIYSGQAYTSYVDQDEVIQKRYDRLFDIYLKACIPAGAKVVDVGCGGGNFLRFAQRVGLRATGYEVDEARVAFCREQGLEVVAGAFTSTTVERESCDMVWMSHVLEHVVEPRQLVRDALQAIRPGGVMSILVPNSYSISTRVCGLHQYSFIPPLHLTHWNEKSLSTLGREAGLEPIRVFSWGGNGQTREIAGYFLRGRFRRSPGEESRDTPAADSPHSTVRVASRIVGHVDDIFAPTLSRIGGTELVGIFRKPARAEVTK